MKREVEILAPAGSIESLKAAILAGADAVYIGGTQFGARAYAKNLSEEELLDAIDYVHIHGRRIYLTVNTLDVPLRVIPDVADNSSLRQAQAKLLSAGFKLNEVQLVNGEKDWVYGVKYQGRQLTAGEKIPMGASLTLMVGDGAGDTVEEDSIDIDLDTEEPVASESSSTQDDSWF